MERRQPRAGHGLGVPFLLLWVAGGAVVLLLRQSGVPAVDTIWAEDGHIFLSDALLVGPVHTVVVPYAGYLNLLPKLLAGIVSLFPVAWASAMLAGAGALVVSGLSAYVFVASRHLLGTVWARGVLAAMVLLLPAAGWESIDNVTNLQWSLILPCLVALLVPAGGAASAVVGFLATTSSPVTLVFLPLAILRALRSLRGEGRTASLAYLVGAGLQVAAIAIAGEDPFRASTDPLALPSLYGLRVAGSVLAGDWAVPAGWSTLGPWFGVGALGLAAGLVAFGCIATGSPRPLAVAGASFGVFAVPVLVRGTSLLTAVPGDLDPAVGSKWVVGAALLLLLAVLLGIDPNLRAGTPARWRAASLVLAVSLTVVLGVAAAAGFRVPNDRAGGPRWSEGIAAAVPACSSGEPVVVVPVSPPGWSAGLPCSRLIEDQGRSATTSIWRPRIGHRNLRER